jgi:hypothetical protein
VDFRQRHTSGVDGAAHRSTQNLATELSDVAAVLKDDSRIAFEAAIEDAWTDPNAAALISLTADHVEESLCAVTTIVFPFGTLVTQKQWMNNT